MIGWLKRAEIWLLAAIMSLLTLMPVWYVEDHEEEIGGMLLAHGVNLGPIDYVPWPAITAVLALGWAVTLFVAVVQTLRLRDRPTRWEKAIDAAARTPTGGSVSQSELAIEARKRRREAAERQRAEEADVHYRVRGEP